MRGVTLARTDSTPVVTDLSGTRMDPLDRAPLRQRIVSIVLSAPSQGSSCSAPPPVPLVAWWSPPHLPSSPLACMHAFSFGRRLRFSNRNLDGVALRTASLSASRPVPARALPRRQKRPSCCRVHQLSLARDRTRSPRRAQHGRPLLLRPPLTVFSSVLLHGPRPNPSISIVGHPPSLCGCVPRDGATP